MKTVKSQPNLGRRPAAWGLTLAFALASCSGHAQSFIPSGNPLPGNALASTADGTDVLPYRLPTPIQHVVIIFQENRTPDYLFQGIPGADIAKTAADWYGERVPLHEVSLGRTTI